jgi:hypothetical protein
LVVVVLWCCMVVRVIELDLVDLRADASDSGESGECGESDSGSGGMFGDGHGGEHDAVDETGAVCISFDGNNRAFRVVAGAEPDMELGCQGLLHVEVCFKHGFII